MEIFGLLWIPNWLLFSLIVFVTYAVYMCKDYNVFKSMGVPGPKPLPVLGNMITYFRKGMLQAQNDWCREYGRIFGVFETSTPTLFVADPEMLKEIYVKQFNNFRNRRVPIKNAPPMDEALTALKDVQWKHVRNTLTPTFSSGKLKKMDNLINNACDKFVANLIKQSEKEDDVEIKLACGNFTMDVIAATLFGMQIDSQVTPNDPFVVNGRILFQFPAWVVVLIVFCPSVFELFTALNLPSPYRNPVKFFQNTIEELLRQRKDDTENYNDFLQLMVNAEKEAEASGEDATITPETGSDSNTQTRKGLTSNEVLAQSLLFFLAGFETVAFSLSMVFYSLALHPDILQKTIEEIDRVLGKDENISYEKAGELHYLDQVISESQRLYPAPVRLDRVCEETTTIKGVTIPKGMVVVIPVQAIHRNKDFWPDPDKFDPERFNASVKADIDPFTFMPFGHGPRNCVAMRLALVEVKMAIARVLQKLKPVKVSRTQDQPKFSKMVFLSVVGGAWIGLEKRGK